MKKEEQSEVNIIKKTCQELGVNQKQLAEKIGVSSNTISGWKNGKFEIPKWGFKILQLIIVEKEHIQLTETIKKYKI